ncbi:hypothetical protein TYRP_011401 [Tyrophagus putrescentiae]|nr:hypothetical protein TYRP_011401 [Tyrophagus putrescentiae]
MTTTLRSAFRKAGLSIAATGGALGGLLLLEHCRRSAPHHQYTTGNSGHSLSAELYNALPPPIKAQLEQWNRWLEEQKLKLIKKGEEEKEKTEKIPWSRRITDQLTWSNFKSSPAGSLNWAVLEQILDDSFQKLATFTRENAELLHEEWIDLSADAAQDWRYCAHALKRLHFELLNELNEAEEQLQSLLEEAKEAAEAELEVVITDAEEYAHLVRGRALNRQAELTADFEQFKAFLTSQVIPSAEEVAEELAKDVETLLHRLQKNVPQLPSGLQRKAEQCLEEEKAVHLYNVHRCQPLSEAWESLIADSRAIAADFAAARTVSIEDVKTEMKAISASLDKSLAVAGQVALALLLELDHRIDQGLLLLGKVITALDVTVLLCTALREMFSQMDLKRSQEKLLQRVEELQEEAMVTYDFLGRPLPDQLLEQLLEFDLGQLPEKALELVALEAEYTSQRMSVLFERTLPDLLEAVKESPEMAQELAKETSLAWASLAEDAVEIAADLHRHSTGVQRVVKFCGQALQTGSWAVKKYLTAVFFEALAPAVGAVVVVLSTPATLVTSAVDHVLLTTSTTPVEDQAKKAEKEEVKEEKDDFSWITSFIEEEAEELVREKYIFTSEDDVLSSSWQMIGWGAETFKEEEEEEIKVEKKEDEKTSETSVQQEEDEECSTEEGDVIFAEDKKEDNKLPVLEADFGQTVAIEDESNPDTEKEEEKEEEEDYLSIFNWPYAVETPEDWHTDICIADYSNSNNNTEND